MPNPNNLNILAGGSAGGAAGNSLAWFAAVDTTGPVGVTGSNGVQTITVTGVPTGGTVPLQYNGLSTSVPYNATNTQVQTALQALTGVGGNMTVTGGPGPGTAWVVTVNALIPQTPITTVGATSTLTGGTSPNASVAQTTPGVQTTRMSTALIPAAFKNAGWCSQDGLVAKVNESSNEIKGYGTIAPLRVLINESRRDFDITFQETNQTSLTVYNRLPVGGISVDAAGGFAITLGPLVNQVYAGIFDVVDGLNHLRVYCPRLQVSGIGNKDIKPGTEINYPVTLTALPDASGNNVYEDYVVGALIGTGTG